MPLAIGARPLQVLLDRQLAPVEAAIERLPEATGFRPTPESMSSSELAVHVYQVLVVLTHTAATGVHDPAVLERFPIDVSRPQPPASLLAHARAATEFARGVLERVTDAELAQPVEGGAGHTRQDALDLAVEECLHHRGQLLLHLRLQGIDPPRTA